MTGVAVGTSSHLLWCAAADELSSGGSAFGSEVDIIIGHLDDIKIVFNDEYGMTALDEGIEAGEETTDVVKVETSSRLIKNEERRHLFFRTNIICKLHTLVLAAGEGG